MAEVEQDEREITELTFEVTIRHYVTDSTPNPTVDDIEQILDRRLSDLDFDIEQVSAVRT